MTKKPDSNTTKITWQTDKNSEKNYHELTDWKDENQLTIDRWLFLWRPFFLKIGITDVQK